MGPDEALSVAMRAKPFDDWTREFLAANPDATVLHLGDEHARDQAAELNPVVRRAGATLRWGLQDPHELEKLGLDLLTSWDVSHFAEPECLSYFSAKYRLQFKIATRIPAFRNFAHLLRYRY